MNHLKYSFSVRAWLAGCALALLAAGCGGGRDPILGIGGVGITAVGGGVAGGGGGGGLPVPVAPTVTAVAPTNNATGVAINALLVTAAFSEPVGSISGGASFTLACAAPCLSPSGTVALDASSKIATLSLTAGTTLSPSTVYTATIVGAKSLASGLTMTSPYVWQFTTGVTADTTRPRVVLTVPATTTPGPTAGFPSNSAISAIFSEDMAPASIGAASFTLTCAAPCVSPAGSVSYSVGNKTAVFTPSAALASGTNYTATITVLAVDLAGNALAGNQAALPAPSNYVWTFTTAAPAIAGNISVVVAGPVVSALGICTDASVNVTFNLPSGLRLDPATINAATITLTGPGQTNVLAASVLLDLSGRIATFKPLLPLTPGATYLITVRGGVSGVKDQAIVANLLPTNFTATFTAGACTISPVLVPIVLGASSSFGLLGGPGGLINLDTNTIINGDIGATALSTSVTGFHDAGPGCSYTETLLNVGLVNGRIYTAAPVPSLLCLLGGTALTLATSTQARADALVAYNALAALPAGPNPGAGNLANLVLTSGVYTAAPPGAFTIQGGNLTLDAQGNPNAVFVFQMATSLTVGGPGAVLPSNVILINGAQAKNVFWQVGTAAIINAGGGGTMVGTIIAQGGIALSSAGAPSILTLNGRALSLGASVTTIANTVINVPAP